MIKKSDLKKLQEVVSLYVRIQGILDEVCESTESHGDVFVFGGLCPTSVSVSSIIKDMYVSAVENRNYVQGKINVFSDHVL